MDIETTVYSTSIARGVKFQELCLLWFFSLCTEHMLCWACRNTPLSAIRRKACQHGESGNPKAVSLSKVQQSIEGISAPGRAAK